MLEGKYQLSTEDHRFPRFNMNRLATGLDIYFVPDLETAKIVMSALRTTNPRGRFACEYPTPDGKTKLIQN